MNNRINKNVPLVLFVLLGVFIGLQIAEPVSAVKLVDHGFVTFKDQNSTVNYSWKTYQYSKNNVKIIGYESEPQLGIKVKLNFYLKKVQKNKLKITMQICGFYYQGRYYKYSDSSHEYVKTRMSAAQFYWKCLKPELKSGSLN
ncbi:hypothetical protein [Methanobacterium congolense]|uniref:Region of a membrane-bound protein predicted to be embedded in the membrane n=1 Tax=Methanobacterium congolense TaxID=118062 RepID=A0A1D3L5Y0_9EURY|nr:hypothetical protein [Methanobacterium congolense]SCG86910.1 Region of a membrane-bound protein predicted to be embedded in the membrane [Methanobacterium congolense]